MERRKILLSKLLPNLLLGDIDCPKLLYLIRLKINYPNTRNNNLFIPIPSNTNKCLFVSLIS